MPIHFLNVPNDEIRQFSIGLSIVAADAMEINHEKRIRQEGSEIFET